MSKMGRHSEVYQMTRWHDSKLSSPNPSRRRVRCLLYKVMQSRPQESGFFIQIPVGNLPMKGTYEKNTHRSLAHYFTLDAGQERLETS